MTLVGPPRHHLEMTVSCWAARWTVYLAGELDDDGGRQAQHLVDSMVHAGVTQLDVDLHAVTLSDESGRAAIARLQRIMHARAVKVRILIDNWPPDLVPSGVTTPTPGPGVTVSLGTITRPDGGIQVTAAGHPLYTFAADKASGDTNGDGIAGKWHAARPTAVGSAATSPPANVTTTVAGYKY